MPTSGLPARTSSHVTASAATNDVESGRGNTGDSSVAPVETHGGMVEGSPLIADTVVAQGTKKRHQRSLVCGRQIDLTDTGSEVSSRRKVALPGVELHDLFQGRLTAIVEIGPENSTFRSPGDLKVPVPLAREGANRGNPKPSSPPKPMSSARGDTPVAIHLPVNSRRREMPCLFRVLF